MNDSVFVLVSVVNREITTSVYNNYKNAWNRMFEELTECSDWTNEWNEIYASNKNHDGHCEDICDAFSIGKYTAYANDNHVQCDWSIEEIKNCLLLTNNNS